MTINKSNPLEDNIKVLSAGKKSQSADIYCTLLPTAQISKYACEIPLDKRRRGGGRGGVTLW